MPDRDPFLLRRMVALRQFPIFATAELGELAMLAENVVDAEFPAGALVADVGAPVAAMQLVLDGRIALTTSGSESWGRREVFGTLEVLARRTLVAPAFAMTTTRTLQLFASDVAEVLEENVGVMLATIRDLASRLVGTRPGSPASIAVSIEGPLGLVEKMIVLRQQVPFTRAPLEALAALAQAADEVWFEPGAVVARAGELAAATYVIIEGALRTRSDDGASRVLGPGDSIGPLELLGQVSHGLTIEATTPVRALRSAAPTLLDVIRDHTELGLVMLSQFAGALLDIDDRTN